MTGTSGGLADGCPSGAGSCLRSTDETMIERTERPSLVSPALAHLTGADETGFPQTAFTM